MDMATGRSNPIGLRIHIDLGFLIVDIDRGSTTKETRLGRDFKGESIRNEQGRIQA